MDIDINSERDLGLALRRLRKEAEMTQRELADAVGCSQKWVTQAETGKAMNLGIALRVLKFLQASMRVSDHAPGADPEEAAIFSDIPSPDDILDDYPGPEV